MNKGVLCRGARHIVGPSGKVGCVGAAHRRVIELFEILLPVPRRRRELAYSCPVHREPRHVAHHAKALENVALRGIPWVRIVSRVA
jgi:hypothetical protein